MTRKSHHPVQKFGDVRPSEEWLAGLVMNPTHYPVKRVTNAHLKLSVTYLSNRDTEMLPAKFTLRFALAVLEL